MSDYQFVLSRLQASRGQLRIVAEESGVPYDTIAKIHRTKGRTDPRASTVEKLAAYFRSREKRPRRR